MRTLVALMPQALRRDLPLASSHSTPVHDRRSDGKSQATMPRILIGAAASLAAAGAATFVIVLIINILLFFKLKSMFRHDKPVRR